MNSFNCFNILHFVRKPYHSIFQVLFWIQILIKSNFYMLLRFSSFLYVTLRIHSKNKQTIVTNKVRSSRHTVNSSPVNLSHSCLVTQSTRHKWAHTMHNKAIRCRTDSTQKVLNEDMQETGCWKWTTWKISESVDVGNNGDCSSRSSPTLCHHLLMACWQSATDLLWRLPRITVQWRCPCAMWPLMAVL